MEATETHEKAGGPKDILNVMGRTPAGQTAPFEVRAHDRVDKVAKIFVDYFVSQHQLAPGEYGLALVRDGAAVNLTDASRLEDHGVVDNDILALIAKAPEIDG
jgi:hypothetical protein